MRRRTRLLATALIGLIPGALVAQDEAARAAPAGLAVVAGASRVVLDSATIRASGARTLPELLSGRVAGLAVTYETGILAAAPRIHVRGSAGAIGSPEPLLYVDGLLQREEQYGFGSPIPGSVAMYRPAFNWEIPVDDIARVEVVLGAAGGALLEFGAARGAVLVTTRRPEPGTLRFSASVETLMPSAPTAQRDNYGSPSPQFADPRLCTLVARQSGQCTPTGLQSFNPLENSGLFADPVAGTRAAVSAAGGVLGGGVRVALDAERAGAIIAGDERDILGISAAFTREIGRRVTLGLDSRFKRTEGHHSPYTGIVNASNFGATADDSLGGFFQTPLSTLMMLGVDAAQDRLSSGMNVRWTMRDRLQLGARITGDIATRSWIRRSPALGPFVASETYDGARDEGFGLTFDASHAHRLFGLPGRFDGLAALRTAWLEERTTTQPTGGPIGSMSFVRQLDRQLALAVREQLDLGPARRIGLGVRLDRWGKKDWAIDAGIRPTFDASWTISDEPFFPSTALLSTLRLHAAHGSATDAAANVASFLTLDTPFTPRRAQRFSETEAGVEVGLLRGALTLDGTLFSRTESDAMVVSPYPVATGFGEVILQRGGWTISGADLRLAVAPKRVGPLEWNAALNASVLKYGNPDLDLPPYIDSRGGIGNTLFDGNRPLGTIMATPIRWSDADGNGLIDTSEVTAPPGETIYKSSLPTRVLGLTSSLRLGRLTLGAQLDGQFGHSKWIASEWSRCQARHCRAMHDSAASLADQARAIGIVYISPGGDDFLEDASFLRLREAWLRIDLGGLLPRAVAKQSDLIISGRNLVTWTGYRGIDPEAGSLIGPSLRSSEYAAIPLLRTMTVRLRMAW